ncbi:MAG: biotin--[acetyl-CoA-carboxylase] ligase [Burkholderiales bacterium]|nr:biotin--[acetyl-CoA-carboxylase] ligase [Burkholderiales bacterium]
METLALDGVAVERVDEIDSTSSELMRRARAGRTDAVLLVARRQTAGRGRLGRSWASAPGASLTFSLGLALAPSDWSGLSLAVGVSLAECLHPRIQLKWPNDLWFEGRKLGGILIETATSSDAPASALRYAVVGVGLNILPTDAQGLSVPPACLAELVPGIDAETALQEVAGPLVATVHAFESFGFTPFQARFMARDALRDRTVQLSGGARGTAHGVTERGSLLVHTEAGMQAVTSAEVSVRPA